MSSVSATRVIRMIEEFLRNIQTPIPEVKAECDALLILCENKTEWDGIIRKVVALLGEYDERIASRDDSLILQGVEIMPGIVLKKYWEALSEKTKDAVWKYINLIMLAGAKYINNSKKHQSSSAEDETNERIGDDDEHDTKEKTQAAKSVEDEIAERLKDPVLREKMIETIRKTIENNVKSGSGNDSAEETAENIKRFMDDVKETNIGKMVHEISQDLSSEFTAESLHLPEGKALEDMNLEDVLGLMGNSEVSSKIFGMVGKISEKINARIQSGEFSKETLAKESQEFLGKSKDLIGLLNPQAAAMLNSLGLGGVSGKQMKKAMKKASKMLEDGNLPDLSKLSAASTPGGVRVSTTRDRLRKKLEERKASATATPTPTQEASKPKPTPDKGANKRNK